MVIVSEKLLVSINLQFDGVNRRMRTVLQHPDVAMFVTFHQTIPALITLKFL